MPVSKRIKEICEYINNNSRVADIGCDHGYLILEAIASKKILYAQLIDNKIAPLEKAKTNLKNIKLNMDYTLSDGLDDLNPIIDTVVIAGMGGILIKEILQKNLVKLENRNLIIQANNNLERLREFLYNNLIYPVSEKIIFEKSYFYQIMYLKKEKTIKKYNFEDLYLGMKLKNSNSVILKKYCSMELKKYEKIKEDVSENKDIELIEKKINVLRKTLRRFINKT